MGIFICSSIHCLKELCPMACRLANVGPKVAWIRNKARSASVSSTAVLVVVVPTPKKAKHLR